jgi:hypothetical protein
LAVAVELLVQMELAQTVGLDIHLALLFLMEAVVVAPTAVQ